MAVNRRTFLTSISLAASTRLTGANTFEPTWESLRTHKVPEWYDNAKLGIFIHWGLYSVPAWAPTTGELGKVDWSKWFYQNAYAEWYLNSLRLKDTPTYEHHVKTYGANFDYYDFARTFNAGLGHWDPAQWATLFRRAGARYAVLTTKHHDGFTMWPSQVVNPKKANNSVKRDLVGDLAGAIRKEGLKMGLYYSGGLDWTFNSAPIAKMEDLKATAPQSEEYARYADAHVRELIARYKPSVLWNDINYPKLGKIPQIFAEYYNAVPEGVINNRFGVDFSDFTTPEYAKYDKITEKKWESCRGLGFSFGYNRMEGPDQVIASDKLVALLADIVSKNGNLLLNIGPKADGSISDIQLDRLHALARWMDINGEAIHDTKPWTRAAAKSGDGTEIRFTRKPDAAYSILLTRPNAGAFTIPGISAPPSTRVTVLGLNAPLKWWQEGADISVTLPERLPGEYAVALKMSPAPTQTP